MRLFKDSKDRSWSLDLNLLTAKAVESADFSAVYHEKHVKLLDKRYVDREFFTSFLMDASCMAFMAWVMIYEQAKSAGVTEEDFCSSLGGKEIMNLREVLWEEIADFFHEYRTSLLKLVETYKLVQRDAEKRVSEVVDQIAEETRQELAGIGKTFG